MRAALGTMLAFVVWIVATIALTGCMSATRVAIGSSNAVREIGHGSADVLHQLCTEPYMRAADLDPEAARREVDRLDAMGCREAAAAHEVLRTSHVTLVSVLQNVQDGRCTAARDHPPDGCDLVGALTTVTNAATDLGAAIQHVQEGSR